MIVICPVCRKQFDSVLRRCPDCGQTNLACTSKFQIYSVELDESVMHAFRMIADELSQNPLDLINEAIEEWIDRRQKGKR